MPRSSNSDIRIVRFEYFEIHVYQHWRKSHGYLSPEGTVTSSQEDAAWFESPAEAYQTIKCLPRGMGVFVVAHNLEYQEFIPSRGLSRYFPNNFLEMIPEPYSMTAYAWYDGIDLRKKALSSGGISKSTYYRHRRKLLEYGFDISKKCNVRILRFV